MKIACSIDLAGYYLYVDSSGRAAKDNARLISLEIPPATEENIKCMKFFYHMYGRTTGTLSLTMYPTSQQPRVLFTKSGSQENRWIPANVTLSSSVKFQVIGSTIIIITPSSTLSSHQYNHQQQRHIIFIVGI